MPRGPMVQENPPRRKGKNLKSRLKTSEGGAGFNGDDTTAEYLRLLSQGLQRREFLGGADGTCGQTLGGKRQWEWQWEWEWGSGCAKRTRTRTSTTKERKRRWR